MLVSVNYLVYFSSMKAQYHGHSWVGTRKYLPTRFGKALEWKDGDQIENWLKQQTGVFEISIFDDGILIDKTTVLCGNGAFSVAIKSR